MSLTMSFDVQLATEIGLNEAIILQSIGYWVLRNRANEKNIYDGKAWSYNSMKAFGEQFPFLTKRQIEYTLTKLQKDGLIETGNYNRMAFDRTKWYTLTEKGEMLLTKSTHCISQNEGIREQQNVKSDFTKCGNEISQNVVTNTNIYQYIPSIKKEIYKEKVEDDVPDLELDEKTKDKKSKKKAYGEYKKVLLTDEELERLKAEFPTNWQEWIDRVDGYCAQNGKQYKNFLATIRNWARRDKERGSNVGGNGKRYEKPRVGETVEEGGRFVNDFMGRLRQRYAERGVTISG